MKVKIINGPNLNMLGIRDQSVYGKETYENLENKIRNFCIDNDILCDFVVSNHEGALIDAIQDTYMHQYDALIINPGAYTHYSYAIRDALEILTCLKIEVHISDIYAREDFRKINVVKDVCDYSVVGKGLNGYIEAIKYILAKK